MKHTGKLHPAQAGEIQHVVNNKLATVLLLVTLLSDNEKAQEQIMDLAEYIKRLGDKTEWDSSGGTDEAA